MKETSHSKLTRTFLFDPLLFKNIPLYHPHPPITRGQTTRQTVAITKQTHKQSRKVKPFQLIRAPPISEQKKYGRPKERGGEGME